MLCKVQRFPIYKNPYLWYLLLIFYQRLFGSIAILLLEYHASRCKWYDDMQILLGKQYPYKSSYVIYFYFIGYITKQQTSPLILTLSTIMTVLLPKRQHTFFFLILCQLTCKRYYVTLLLQVLIIIIINDRLNLISCIEISRIATKSV